MTEGEGRRLYLLIRGRIIVTVDDEIQEKKIE
jgi:hypothetical protein